MGTKKERSSIAAGKLLAYDKLIAAVPGLERKGATMPYTSVNGHMFSLFDKDGAFALRLSKEDRDSFIAKYNTTLHNAYGIVMKEYVTVPDNAFDQINELKKYFKLSYIYVSSLKPKPISKKK